MANKTLKQVWIKACRIILDKLISITANILVVKYEIKYRKALEYVFHAVPADKTSWTETWHFAPLCAASSCGQKLLVNYVNMILTMSSFARLCKLVQWFNLVSHSKGPWDKSRRGILLFIITRLFVLPCHQGSFQAIFHINLPIRYNAKSLEVQRMNSKIN